MGTDLDSMNDVQGMIAEECDKVKALLLQKNADYGNSALQPRRIFSKASPLEQLLVRIDDKLSRIANAENVVLSEDTVQDLIGYLILYRVALRVKRHHEDEPGTLERDNSSSILTRSCSRLGDHV